MASQRIYLVAAVAATENGASVGTFIQGDFAASLKVTNYSGLDSIDCVLQESPSPKNVSDADATWYVLGTFAQVIAAGQEKITITTPHFSRMRIANTVAGTGTADAEVIVEGVEV